MEKSEFLERAPQYYALALAQALLTSEGRARTIPELDRAIDVGRYRYFQHGSLVDVAFNILIDAGVVEEITDDFGPTVYRARPSLDDWLDAAANSADLPVFKKFQRIRSTSWLKRLLDQSTTNTERSR